MTEFFIPMNPPTVTAQERKVTIRNGKPYFYEPAEVKDARMKLMDHLTAYRPDVPYESGLMFAVKWCFPISGNHHDGEYRITKPDTDNLQKMLKDVMTELHFWKDDALVCCEMVEKFWAEIPGIFIQIEEV